LGLGDRTIGEARMKGGDIYDGVGQIILSHWLHGNGQSLHLREGLWSDYKRVVEGKTHKGDPSLHLPAGLGAYMWKGLMAGDGPAQSKDKLEKAMTHTMLVAVGLAQPGDFSESIKAAPPYAETAVHLDVPNGEGITGHNFLHGSNSRVGDVSVVAHVTSV